MYTVQNKVLPGAYINFVSAARASATLGDRGTAAFPLSLDWGPENEVVTIENSEFQKGSLLAKFDAGDSLLDEELSGTFDGWDMPEEFTELSGME